MSRAVLNSSVMIALSTLGYLDKLKHIFTEVSITRAVQEEICVRGRGLIGEHELLEAVKDGLIIQPLTPQQMLEAYRKRFKIARPFTEEALITLTQMSRGIFRRYLRYITATLEHWQAQPTPNEPITKEIVKGRRNTSETG